MPNKSKLVNGKGGPFSGDGVLRPRTAVTVAHHHGCDKTTDPDTPDW